MLFTRLAAALNIRTPGWAIIEHDAETYFGSLSEPSSALPFEARDYLTTPQHNELGQMSHFPGEFLAELLAFDLFIGNSDRGLNNFLVLRDGSFPPICAVDFADGEVGNLASGRFPVATSPTVIVGKRLAAIHGSFARSAVGMVDRIAALPAHVFTRLVRDVPSDWLSADRKGDLDAVWESPGFYARLDILRSRLKDGTLV
jgi:hypothetical protein